MKHVEMMHQAGDARPTSEEARNVKTTQQKPDKGRRNFLKFAAVSAPAAAATAVTGTKADAAEVEPEGTGLRETAHVKAYLKSARF